MSNVHWNVQVSICSCFLIFKLYSSLSNFTTVHDEKNIVITNTRKNQDATILNKHSHNDRRLFPMMPWTCRNWSPDQRLPVGRPRSLRRSVDDADVGRKPPTGRCRLMSPLPAWPLRPVVGSLPRRHPHQRCGCYGDVSVDGRLKTDGEFFCNEGSLIYNNTIYVV